MRIAANIQTILADTTEDISPNFTTPGMSVTQLFIKIGAACNMMRGASLTRHQQPLIQPLSHHDQPISHT